MLPLHLLLPTLSASESASGEETTDVSAHLVTFDFKRPVLSIAVVDSSVGAAGEGEGEGEEGKGKTLLWASLDTREDVGAPAPPAGEEEDVRVLELTEGKVSARPSP